MALVLPQVPNIVRLPQKLFTFTGAAGLGAIGQTNPIWTPTGGSVYLWLGSLRIDPALAGALGGVSPATLSLGTAAQIAYILGAQAIVGNLNAIGWWMDGGGSVNRPDLSNDLVSGNFSGPLAVSAPITMDVLADPIVSGAIAFNGYYVAITPGATLV